MIFLLYACKDSKTDPNLGRRIELNDDIKEIMANYIKYEPCQNCVYEMYLDKIDPHYAQIFLYKGVNSLTFEEYVKNEKQPSFYTEVGGKKISIYTGAENYIRKEKDSSLPARTMKQMEKSYNIWVIIDSMNVRRIDTLGYAYPFLPLPAKVDFDSPYKSKTD